MVTIVNRSSNSERRSLNNRQRFIKRHEEQIRRQVGESLGDISIDTMRGKNGTYKVPIRGTKEPSPHQDGTTGDSYRVIQGDGTIKRGDTWDKPQGGGAGGGGQEGSPDGTGEDDFVFTMTQEEFLRLFMDDLELPDMNKKSGESEVEFKSRRAGYSTTGSQNNLDIGVTIKQSLARKLALKRPTKGDVAALEAEIEAEQDPQRLVELKERLDAMQLRMKRVPWVADIDLRFKSYVQEPVPTTHAVMFCVMDVSGSMGEHEKDLAKRFMLLLNLLLHKKYKQVDVVFIRYHSEPRECSESEFFGDRDSGGTMFSPALKMVEEIIEQRYTQDWNIYMAVASDGDNYPPDMKEVSVVMKRLIPMMQYIAYLEASSRDHSEMWSSFEEFTKGSKTIQQARVHDRKEIWPVFRELYKKVSGQPV